MPTRREVSSEYARRYKRSGRKGKTLLLNEFVELTGYNRCYGSFILRNWGRKVYLKNRYGFVDTVVIGELRQRRYPRHRKRKYDESVFQALFKIWEVLNYPCGKRLQAELGEMIKKASQFKEIKISDEVVSKLNQISPSTIDRLLKSERKKQELKCRGRTKPGTLLKKQIEVRTGTDWNEDEAGYVEIDLVSHDGGNTSGEFCQTLNCVDVKSGWVEMAAVKNKAQIWTLEALKNIRERLPFELKGIDSDNGSEFINAYLFEYCRDEKILFTRSRSSHKNDNCYVEQKNFTAVRTYVGHMRYDNEEERAILNKLYSDLRLYLNYFQPSMKLVSKERIGSKVTKKYDRARTPFQRLLETDDFDEARKTELKSIYKNLNPFELKRSIDALQSKLFHKVYLKKKGLYLNRDEYRKKVSTF